MERGKETRGDGIAALEGYGPTYIYIEKNYKVQTLQKEWMVSVFFVLDIELPHSTFSLDVVQWA